MLWPLALRYDSLTGCTGRLATSYDDDPSHCVGHAQQFLTVPPSPPTPRTFGSVVTAGPGRDGSRDGDVRSLSMDGIRGCGGGHVAGPVRDATRRLPYLDLAADDDGITKTCFFFVFVGLTKTMEQTRRRNGGHSSSPIC